MAIDVRSMTPEEVADAFGRLSGKPIDADRVRRDLHRGAPSEGGRVNLIHYAAWLLKECRSVH